MIQLFLAQSRFAQLPRVISSFGVVTSSGTPTVSTSAFTLPDETSAIQVAMRRRSTLRPNVWMNSSTASAKMRVYLSLDGVETLFCEGQCSGDIRTKRGGGEVEEYVLTAFPTRIIVDSSPTTVIEMASSAAARIEVSQLSGWADTTLDVDLI